MDRCNHVTPAPAVAGLFFPSMLIYIMTGSFQGDAARPGMTSLHLKPKRNSETAERELDNIYKLIDQFRLLEPGSDPFLPDIKRVQEKLREATGHGRTKIEALSECAMHEIWSMHRRAKAAGLEHELKELVRPDPAGSKGPFEEEPNPNERLENFFFQNMFKDLMSHLGRRSFFSTARSERLGMGNEGIEDDDEVWMLNGASVPVILRPLPNGHYAFCGDTYIQGMMYGEVANEPDSGRDAEKRIIIE